MQKATYLASLILDRVVWPSSGGAVVFSTQGKVLVEGHPMEWTGPAEMHTLLMSLSWSPYMLNLSQPLVGKLDIWIKTTALRTSLRNEMQIPMELELTQLFRMAVPRLIVSPPTDDALAEVIPSSIGKLVSSARFKVLDELFWDGHLGGFVRGAVPFDVPSVPLSIVFSPHGCAWNTQLMTDSFFAMVAKLPTARAEPLSVRVGCVLVIDNSANPIDVRMLTLEQLQVLSALRIRLVDFQTWANSRAVPPLDGSASSMLNMRKSLFNAEQHPRFNIHPFHIHWKAAVWPVGTVFQGRVPRADWVFAIQPSADSWASGFISSAYALDHLFSQLRVPDTMPEMWNTVSRNSWRLPLQKKRLMVRLNFYEVSSSERLLFRDAQNKMMASFGLVQKPNSTWCPKAGLLRLFKRDGILASDRLEQCLEGFTLHNAKELLDPSRPQCIVCASNVCDTFLDACGHTFCDTCVQQHVRVGGTSCPVCRADLPDKGWTQVRRVTSRRLHDAVSFAKQDQLVNLARNLRGNLVFVAPSVDCGRQVVQWCGEAIDIQTPTDPPLAATRQFDHIVCSTCLLPTVASVRLLHELFQKHSTDTTTLHVLVARGGTHADEDFSWVRDFSKCYPNLIEMSMYS